MVDSAYNNLGQNGSGWAILTEHSDYRPFGLFTKTLIQDTWDQEMQDITEETPYFAVFQGEEITIGNGNDLKTDGHLLAYGLKDPLSGLPKPVISIYNKSDTSRRKAQDLLYDVRNLGGFGFIAHPYKFGLIGPGALVEQWDKDLWK